ncbi:hypothetical protein IT774_12400 [Salinimonas marina]|uniref:UDP-2,4-diacetamido-2,4, 6-trideoxy-beta-L-altropyranose hydrolase n=1 Tax=Salinimonas marina TaxID=2785918 RepID=A0A7S9HCX6_9ALTE|nr:hypothetical protein [Salinimonas marina]QPG04951.1 hypothetical protein IT774_12400 [Salinimonas marina]
MRAVFRVDGSTHIGAGHVMRCLTLAKALHPMQCVFVCRDLPGHMQDTIEAAGFECRLLGAVKGSDENRDAEATLAILNGFGPFSLLVVDHYALGARYCQALQSQRQATLVIDDLANRPHYCDFLLDQNLFSTPRSVIWPTYPPPRGCCLAPDTHCCVRNFMRLPCPGSRKKFWYALAGPMNTI